MIGRLWKRFLNSMEPLNLLEIAKAVKGKFFSTPPHGEEGASHLLIRRVVIDSRVVSQGDLFIAFSGEKTDGHLHIEDAFKRGAVACLITRPVTETKGGPLILVENAERALMRLASWYRLSITAPVIAITGSSGKTTAKEMTAHLLSLHHPVLKAPESYNNEIGVPLTVLAWEPSQQAVVLEMAMRGKGQIKVLCDIASPTVGMITSIGEAHIGLLGSIKDIADAKGELLESLPLDGLAFLNGEDSWTDYLRKKASCPVRTYGFDSSQWIHAENIRETWEGTHGLLVTPFGNQEIFVPLLGRHNLLNFLGATAIALSFQVSLEEIAQGALSCHAPHGRLEQRKRDDGVRVLDDSYNANPASLLAAMRTVAVLPTEGRRILVLGDMLELGDAGRKAHEDVVQQMLDQRFDALFAMGELARQTVDEAQKAKLRVAKHFDTHQELLGELNHFVKPHDVVLVKGSRKMGMERISKGLLKT